MRTYTPSSASYTATTTFAEDAVDLDNAAAISIPGETMADNIAYLQAKVDAATKVLHYVALTENYTPVTVAYGDTYAIVGQYVSIGASETLIIDIDLDIQWASDSTGEILLTASVDSGGYKSISAKATDARWLQIHRRFVYSPAAGSVHVDVVLANNSGSIGLDVTSSCVTITVLKPI